MKQFILFFLVGITCSQAWGQRICGTVNYLEQTALYKTNPPIMQEGSGMDSLPNQIITIPVVVHILYNSPNQNISEDQIRSQLLVLNNDYNLRNANAVNIPEAFKSKAGIANFNFCLAGVVRQPTSIISFEMNDAMKANKTGGSDGWDSKRYLNIWVCNLKGRMLGYASAPGSPANVDGVVITFTSFGTKGTAAAPFNLGRTGTHEIGHWLGLKHIWGDDDCGSDDIDDTPQQRSYNYGCPNFPRTNNCTTTPDGEMFMNYMDFTNDACMSLFTQGQVNKMRSLFAKNNYKSSFLSAPACNYTGPVEGPAKGPVVIIPPVVSVDNEIEVNIYPNPAGDYININVKAEGLLAANSFAELYNANGKKVYNVSLTQNTSRLNIQQLVAGIYYLNVNTGKIKKRLKIVKL